MATLIIKIFLILKNLMYHETQLLATDRWFSQGTLVSSTNKTDCHDITEKLLKAALSTKKPTNQQLELT
jgi:hypothetical protein